MAPSKDYMLNRALQQLEAILSTQDMTTGEMKHLAQIAADEIRNVIAVLNNERNSK